MARAAVPLAAPPRRVTRSQSREVEDSPTSNVLTSKGGREHAGFAKAGGSRLSMVHEESPTFSRPTSVSRLGTSMVPESPSNQEGNSNISGTTFLPQDSSFEDGEPDPIILVEELPDLQNAANRFLDLFVSNASDPRSILESVKRITNPRNTDSKRLKLAMRKLVSTMSGFSNQAFVDVAQLSQLIPSVQPRDSARSWSPAPILQRANCARLALDVLLVSNGSQSPRQSVERLKNQFPTPFMSSIVRRSQPKPVGASTAEKQTFELALEIRTQYFVMELEEHQNDKDFDPRAILKRVFYDEQALAEDASAVDPGFLRGFKLVPTFEDENGRLPDRYQDDVIDRISELEYDLFDQDEQPNIRSLKRASWTRFVQRTARFVFSRDKEILSDLQQQPKFEEVEGLVRRAIEHRDDLASHGAPDRHESAVPDIEDRSSRALLPREDRDTPREPSAGSTSRAPREKLPESLPETIRPHVSPQVSVGQSAVNRVTLSPATDRNRRKSSKGARKKLFAHSLDAIQRRESRHRQQEMSHLESQHPDRPAGPQGTTTLSVHEPPANTHVDEVPQSPPPRQPDPMESPLFAAQGSPLFTPGDGESLNLDGLEAEAEATTSPAMRRTHEDNGLFVSPAPERLPTSAPLSRADFRNILNEPQPLPRTWIDRQPNARRISPISESQSAQRPRALAVAPSISRKRHRPDSNSDDSDDGFDQDNRDIDTTARRTQKPPQAARPVDKRPRVERRTESDAARQLQENLTTSSQNPPTRTLPFASTQAGTQPAEQQRRSSWLAANSVSEDQPPTVDLPGRTRGKNTWSQAETERLLMLMARHGTAWVEIKRQDDLCPPRDGGPLLTKRSQVNLKDKARNLKEKYIRERLPMPKNLDQVVSRRGP